MKAKWLIKTKEHRLINKNQSANNKNEFTEQKNGILTTKKFIKHLNNKQKLVLNMYMFLILFISRYQILNLGLFQVLF